jgi:hypothetical protein
MKNKAVFLVTFSCIHEKFRAGKKYLCADCVKKDVLEETGRMKKGVMYMRNIKTKTECEGCK